MTMARRWTADEDEQVRSFTLNSRGWRVLARRLGRSHAAVVNRAVVLRKQDPARWCPKIRRSGRPRAWTQSDDARVLRLDREGMALDGIAAALGRTPKAVRQRLYRLRGAPGSRPTKLSPNERRRAATLARDGSTAPEIARQLGRSITAIRRALQVERVQPRRKNQPYTARDDADIMTMLSHGETIAVVARWLGRKHASVARRARALGVLGEPKSPRAWTTSEARRLLQLHRQGRSPKQIAAALGRTVHAVRAKLRR